MSFIPGMSGRILGGGRVNAKSFSVGAADTLTRTLSTSSPNTLQFTYSLWVKAITYEIIAGDPTSQTLIELFSVANSGATLYNAGGLIDGGNEIEFLPAGFITEGHRTNPTPDIPLNTWKHIVYAYDSTQGTSSNRLKIYYDGVLMPNVNPAVGASTAHRMFTNAYIHRIGHFDPARNTVKKLAFIDVVEGLQLDATPFAFSNGGTWTSKRYEGSRGAHGFGLDGINSYNDVGPNGQNFTAGGGTSLDAADLPPYI